VLPVYRAWRVLRADRRGSSWPVLVQTEAGVFHTKLRGAAQAPASLVAEIIVGGLADAIGLRVPARVLIEIAPELRSDDRNDELAQLLTASVGRNLGFQLLPEVTDFQPEDATRVPPDLGAAVLWLDGLVQNPDRTAANPNLLWSHGTLWLVDHGACLGFQHDWAAVTEDTPRVQGHFLERHVLRTYAPGLRGVDDSLAARLSRSVLEAAVDAVPEEYLAAGGGSGARARRRARYAAFLWKRLKAPRPFL
jgi:HipA-like protein